MRIKDISKENRPRERMLKNGSSVQVDLTAVPLSFLLTAFLEMFLVL